MPARAGVAVHASMRCVVTAPGLQAMAPARPVRSAMPASPLRTAHQPGPVAVRACADLLQPLATPARALPTRAALPLTATQARRGRATGVGSGPATLSSGMT